MCLDRFREKKTNVIEALRETCEAAYPGVRFFFVAREIDGNFILDKSGTNVRNSSSGIGSQNSDCSTMYTTISYQMFRHGNTSNITKESSQDLSSSIDQSTSLRERESTCSLIAMCDV